MKINQLVLLVSLSIPSLSHADISSLWKSCDEQYRDAWAECNQDYYGKCKFLGKKYKPNCTPGAESLYHQLTQNKKSENRECEKKYVAAWARCNADYNGKCQYLGPKYKPSCERQ